MSRKFISKGSATRALLARRRNQHSRSRDSREGKSWWWPEEVPCRTSGQDKDNLTAFLVQNTNGLSGEILSGEINVLFISYQIWKLDGLNSYQHASSWQLWHKNIVYMWTNMISTGYLPSKCKIYCSLIHLHYLIEIFFAPKDDH